MAIRQVYIVSDGDNIIQNQVEVDDTVHTPPPGHHWEDIPHPEDPNTIQDVGMLFDPDFEWKLYVDDISGEFLGRHPYQAYAGEPVPPSYATIVETLPPDISHYSQTSQMLWNFGTSEWFWPPVIVKQQIDVYVSQKIESGIVYDGNNYPTDEDAQALYTAMFRAIYNCVMTDMRAMRKNSTTCVNVTNQYIMNLIEAVDTHVQNCREAQKTANAAADALTLNNPVDVPAAVDAAYNALVSVPIPRAKVDIGQLISDAIAVAVPAAVSSAIAALVDDAPEDLDTLKEFATALNDNPNFYNDIVAAFAGKVDKVTGKGLSENDFTNALKAKLEALNGALTIQTGTFTRGTGDASGNQEIACSFQPSLILFSAYDTGAGGDGITSDGWDTGASCAVTRTSLQDVLTTLGGLLGSVSVTKKDHSNAIWVQSGTTGWRANVNQVASDKFRLGWTKIGAGRNITGKYIAIK